MLLFFWSSLFGWMASFLLLPVASCWCFHTAELLVFLFFSVTCFLMDVFQATCLFSLFLSFPSLSLFFSFWASPYPSSSLCYLFSIYFLNTHLPYPPPTDNQQTYPITRTITVKARQWIKGMISPQWPTPWRGWVPPRLCPPSPAVPAPSPACTTASCSALAARRPLRG